MKRIRQTNDLVKDILENVPETRNSDDLLYVNVVRRVSPMLCQQPFSTVMLRRSEFKIPPFESVRRSRQKLQASYPELCGTDDVEAYRVMNEEAVRNYARSVSV